MTKAYTTIKGKWAGEIDHWVVINNDYIDPDIESGVVFTGLPISNLKNKTALESRIKDIQEDIDNDILEDGAHLVDMSDAIEAVDFLKSFLTNIKTSTENVSIKGKVYSTFSVCQIMETEEYGLVSDCDYIDKLNMEL